MDKAGLQRAWGGPIKGEIANHIVPDTMFNGDLDDYDPYRTEDDAGDVDKAKEEMKQSKYDTDQDGVCDAPECSGVLLVNRNTPSLDGHGAAHRAGVLPKIGIKVNTREFEDAYTGHPGHGQEGPDLGRPRLGQGLRGRLHVHGALRQSVDPPAGQRELLPRGPDAGPGEEGQDRGHARRTSRASTPTSTRATSSWTTERLTCWEDLDKKLMERSFRGCRTSTRPTSTSIGPAVTKYEYDQFSGDAAYARVAVDPSKQK